MHAGGFYVGSLVAIAWFAIRLYGMVKRRKARRVR